MFYVVGVDNAADVLGEDKMFRGKGPPLGIKPSIGEDGSSAFFDRPDTAFDFAVRL